MNFIKKIFRKTKIDEIKKTDIIRPELIVLSKYKNVMGFYDITCLCVFDKSYIIDFLEVISTNKLRMSIKENGDKIYSYFIISDIKGLINNLSSSNIFFSTFKDLIQYFPCKNKYYNDGIIDRKDLDISMVEEVDINKIILKDLNKMDNDIFTFRDLSILLLIDSIHSIYDVLTDEDLNSTILFDKLSSIYGDKIILALNEKKYNENYKDEDIDNLISEVIDEKLVITEDENGNLIYDKDQFE